MEKYRIARYQHLNDVWYAVEKQHVYLFFKIWRTINDNKFKNFAEARDFIKECESKIKKVTYYDFHGNQLKININDYKLNKMLNY